MKSPSLSPSPLVYIYSHSPLVFIICNNLKKSRSILRILFPLFSLLCFTTPWTTNSKPQQHLLHQSQSMFPPCSQTLLHLHLLHLPHTLPHLSLHPLRALPLLLPPLRRRRWSSALALPARSSAAGASRSVSWLPISLPLIPSNSPLLIESLEPATSSSSCRYHTHHAFTNTGFLIFLFVALCLTSPLSMAFFLEDNKKLVKLSLGHFRETKSWVLVNSGRKS